ncbi:MAG TPA: protein kinase [Planctomycetota bacterium]|nr:protein kinase [Planctomycetota bacterium]
MARIVVVEDEQAVRAFVARTLADRGHRVAAFKTVGEALPVVEEGGFELLLVDVELPDGCGLDLLGALPEPSRTPAIVMSALNEERDFGRGFAAGAADYMGKPFTAAELQARVSMHLARVRDNGPGLPGEEKLAFGRYKIEKQLGRGSYGRVFRARDAGRRDLPVALKVLVAPEGEEEDARLRFIRETLALARVEHDAIVRILDVGRSRDRIHYSMELVEGPTLDAFVRRQGPLSESQARALVGPLLSALAALERAGIVHRDIKPSNIVLRDGDPGRPVLIDFGLSRGARDRRSTQGNVFLGTPVFMAPEVIEGEDADTRSDLFSLGLTLRFALTGEDVVGSSSIAEVLRAIVSEPVALPDEQLSEPFGLFLSWLLERERIARPPTARSALRALEKGLLRHGA